MNENRLIFRKKSKGIYIKVSPQDQEFYRKLVRESGLDLSQIVRTMLDAYAQMAGIERDETV